jgi:aryl-alcohol dehydrogenase-like predicted oxidoreductase
MRIFEAGANAGIRYIDTAPMYGFGTSETVVGSILGNRDHDFVIATKVGIARPHLPGVLSSMRSVLRPVARVLPAFKRIATRHAARLSPRGKFEPDEVLASFNDSLRELKRDRVDVLLLHEPCAEDITQELLDTLDGLINAGQVGLAGSGTDRVAEQALLFGDVCQHRFMPCRPLTPVENRFRVLHGVLRYGLQQLRTAIAAAPTAAKAFSARYGFDLFDPMSQPAILSTMALAEDENCILLIASHDPARLHECVSRINWSITTGGQPNYVADLRKFLRSQLEQSPAL